MPDFPHLELHRLGVGLVPEPGADARSTAIHIESPGGGRPLRSCACREGSRKTCRHLKQLSQDLPELRRRLGDWPRSFEGSLWYRLAQHVYQGSQVPCKDVRISRVDGENGWIVTTGRHERELARYLDRSPARTRFLERLGKVPEGGSHSDRAGLLERLSVFQMKDMERELYYRGSKSARVAWEESFWYRLAYHCVRELGGENGTFHPAIDQAGGDFTLTFRHEAVAFCQITLPRNRVEAVLKLLAGAFPEQDDLAIHPVPLKSLFHVTATTELDLEVRPVIQALQDDGETRFFGRADLERFRYGNLVYIPELSLLAQLEKEGRERRFTAPEAMKLSRSQVPVFLRDYGEAVREGKVVLDEPLRDLDIFSDFDWVEMAPLDEESDPLGRSWYWLSVRYGFGNQSVSLREILEARSRGLPYIETPAGWVDLRAEVFDDLERWVPSFRAGEGSAGDGGLRLSIGELLRLQASVGKPVRLAEGDRSRALRAGGGGGRGAILARLLELRPSRPYEQPEGLASELRAYQVHGVDWLRFLWENRLAGLLCDDMGLGKTHQVMALMAALREQDGVDAPFLVVCPTTVISHWRNKIRDHAPGLRAAVYHGVDRDLENVLAEGDTVLLTSYGILRRDIEHLAEIPFALAVFDEIQYLKNRATRGYRAAVDLDAEVRLGLTGTPIENSLDELKSLFDLVLPGYLGGDEHFRRRYVSGPAGGVASPRSPEGDAAQRSTRIGELRRLISPFVLRRTKRTVLAELPDKIDDVRTCALSDDQVKLYRDALATRGEELRERIAGDERLPYIHVFALLSYLKQICDHPALALNELDDADSYLSGKWDLFREILRECLDAGLKVVVFTQYLGMIELMERHLRAGATGFAKLTGASRERGAIVDRFNRDSDCRVFLGSLKAGGTGIDLVGGSVVIHYDRWWNAAREDQATDRVHRIGQHRAVQVFKLITEGTLEEKIAAIIERKRELLESVVREDDPGLAKIFTREELLELLRPP